jgi:hypothetical protein
VASLSSRREEHVQRRAGAPSGARKHGHEPKIHVQLLVAVEAAGPGIVGDKVELDLLEFAEHDNVLDHTCRRLAAHAREFEAVAVEEIGSVDPAALPTWRQGTLSGERKKWRKKNYASLLRN